MDSIFFEITIIVCLATLLAIIFRLLKQPTILAYILTGIIIGPFGQLQLGHEEMLRGFGELGITFLLFTLGLELRFALLRSVGKIAGMIGVSQVFLTSTIGFGLAVFLGFSQTVSFFIAVAITFSSTVIVVSLLSDRKNLTSLHGKLLTGLLLVQDFFAVLILIFLSGASNFSKDPQSLFLTYGLLFLKGGVLVGILAFLSKKVFPRLLDSIAKSQEILFLFSIGWVLFVTSVVSLIGFSIEIGGILAGLALANSSENLQIAARVRSLRDFFITIFFVTLGMQMSGGNIGILWPKILIFSLFVLVGKSLIIAIIMGILGYSKRTSFLTGVHAGQISEFSLIIVFLGYKIGFITNDIVFLVTGVSIVTFVFSSYMIFNDAVLYNTLHRYLFFLPRKSTKNEEFFHADGGLSDLEDHVILIGANRTGKSILAALQEDNQKVVVLDFDPDIVKSLKEKGILSLFGDISDTDIQEKMLLHKAKLVISTVSDIEDNLLLLKGLRKKDTVKVIVLAQDADDAKILYKAGADYVILPHLIGGRHLAKMIKEDKLKNIAELKVKDLAYLGV